MKWLHNLLKGLSLTAALFVFQACYGTPGGWEPEGPDMEDNPPETCVVQPAPDQPSVDATAPELPEEPEAETEE